MKVFLNLLAAYSGGQVTRSEEFLSRANNLESVDFIVLKEAGSLKEIEQYRNLKFLNIPNFSSPFRSIKRMFWENVFLPKNFLESGAKVYLTFSHYLPRMISRECLSIVGVSNLAPFSKEAWAQESFLVKLRLFFLKKTILSSCRRATKVLALSHTCKRLLASNGVEESKIFVASNGVGDFWAEKSDKTFKDQLKIKSPYLLYVSHFYFYKNFENLVLSYDRLPSDIKDNYQLVLVGNPIDQDCFDGVKRTIKDLGLCKNVLVFPGLRSEILRDLYQNTDLFIFASLIENSPNILLEAMKAGSPVLTTKFQPMPEFCESSVEYFDGLDQKNLAFKIENLLRNDSRRRKMKILSQQQAGKYNWNDFTDKIVDELFSLKSD